MLCKRIKTQPSWIIPLEYLNTVPAQAEIQAELGWAVTSRAYKFLGWAGLAQERVEQEVGISS